MGFIDKAQKRETKARLNEKLQTWEMEKEGIIDRLNRDSYGPYYDRVIELYNEKLKIVEEAKKKQAKYDAENRTPGSISFIFLEGKDIENFAKNALAIEVIKNKALNRDASEQQIKEHICTVYGGRKFRDMLKNSGLDVNVGIWQSEGEKGEELRKTLCDLNNITYRKNEGKESDFQRYDNELQNIALEVRGNAQSSNNHMTHEQAGRFANALRNREIAARMVRFDQQYPDGNAVNANGEIVNREQALQNSSANITDTICNDGGTKLIQAFAYAAGDRRLNSNNVNWDTYDAAYRELCNKPLPSPLVRRQQGNQTMADNVNILTNPLHPLNAGDPISKTLRKIVVDTVKLANQDNPSLSPEDTSKFIDLTLQRKIAEKASKIYIEAANSGRGMTTGVGTEILQSNKTITEELCAEDHKKLKTEASTLAKEYSVNLSKSAINSGADAACSLPGVSGRINGGGAKR